MKKEVGLEEITRDPSSIVTVGTYDGIHRGHQAVLNYVQDRAKKRNGTSVVVSFDPHPRQVITGEEVSLLTTPDERASILAKQGMDRFILVPFNDEFASLEAEEYVRKFLYEKVGLQEIVIGYDHRFGKGREGDRELLEEIGRELNFNVDVIPAQTHNASKVVSSSGIRELLQVDGNVDKARELLGRYYSLEGKVIEGDGRGKKIGFPTANLHLLDARKAIPKVGVYAVQVEGPFEGRRPGMMNIGYRPTFDGETLVPEVHILDFENDLYSDTLRIEFVQRLRDERRFDSVEDLQKQLSKDRDRCSDVLQAIS